MMKKILACSILLVLLTQLLCCPVAFAKARNVTGDGAETTTTTTTTESTTGVTTTTASDTETTTQKDEPTETTHVETNSTTANVPTGSMKTRLIILEHDGKLAARLTDENGNPVPGVAVKIQIVSTILNATTDENGYAVLRFDMPEKGTYIHCSTQSTIVDGVLYTAAAASIGTMTNTEATTTTQGQEVETNSTTAIPTYNRTNKVTTARKTTEAPTWYTYAATTGMEASYVSLGCSFDSGILSVFNTDETTFYNTVRLLLSPETYAKIIGDMKGTLLMTASASAAEVTDEQIAAALQGDAVLSHTDAKGVERVVIDLALQLQSPTGKQTDIWSLAADSYVIQLPIPHNMRSAKAIAVAAVTESGISAPVYTTVSKDGFLRFDTTSPVGTIVLLGFKNSLLAAFSGDSAVLAIVFLVVGLLCIGGAVFLYIYFFYLPRRAKKKEAEAAANEAEEQPAEVETDETPVFEDVPLTEGNERIAPTDTLDIFADADTEQPANSGRTSNIDIPL